MHRERALVLERDTDKRAVADVIVRRLLTALADSSPDAFLSERAVVEKPLIAGGRLTFHDIGIALHDERSGFVDGDRRAAIQNQIPIIPGCLAVDDQVDASEMSA